MLEKETILLDRYLKLPYGGNGGERVKKNRLLVQLRNHLDILHLSDLWSYSGEAMFHILSYIHNYMYVYNTIPNDWSNFMYTSEVLNAFNTYSILHTFLCKQHQG